MGEMRGGRGGARHASLTVTAAVLCGVLAGCGSPHPARANSGGRPVPASALRRLTVLAGNFAKANGDSGPRQMSAVRTTRAKAFESAALDGSSANGSAPVYLITMRGHFTAYGASPPKGAPLPTGTYLSVVVNARTFAVEDWGLSPGPPRVSPSALGPVTHLP